MTCSHAPSGCDYPAGQCAGFCVVTYWANQAVRLVRSAEADGVIVTVDRVPVKPLAMGNNVADVQVRMKRGFVRAPADDTEGGLT